MTTRSGFLLVMLVLAAVDFRPAYSAQILRDQAQGGQSILRVDRVVRLQLDLPVGAEAAFDAWTLAPQLVEWLSHWAEMKVDLDAEFHIGWEGIEGEWQGRYVEVSRPERLAFTWLPPEAVFPAGAYETVVTLTFEEGEEGRTLLTLEHSGFRDTPEMEAQLQAWRSYMFALRAFLLRSQAQ